MTNSSEWLTPPQISKMVPSRMGGRNVSPQTVRRWQLKGLQGIYLQSMLVGGVRCSTKEQIEQFIRDLTERDFQSRFHHSDEPRANLQPLALRIKKHESAERAARELGL